MSYRKYKILDILVWLVVFLGLEFLIIKAETVWFKEEPYSVSLMLPLLLILLMRWGAYSFIHAIIYAAAFVLYLKAPGDWTHYVIYIFGNLGFMCSFFFLKFFGKEKTKSTWYWTGLYVLIGYLLMECFRGFAAMAVSNVGFGIILQFLLTDSLNLAFAFVVCLVARQIPGLFEDQKEYLLKLHSEDEASKKLANNGVEVLDSSTIDKLKGDQQ